MGKERVVFTGTDEIRAIGKLSFSLQDAVSPGSFIRLSQLCIVHGSAAILDSVLPLNLQPIT
eukprot:m.20027 g.20027  ORF g.20027 m.20027 type:complete len:62 (+) comp8106_c0_seq1:511-696(+)